MSFYFRDKPKFGDRLRGKSGDELLQEIKQQFDEDSKSFFEPRSSRDSFDRQSSFSRGFPFDDDGFGRRSDIRAHLDDLAARHPEFADHLLGPPWGDIPFHSSFRNRNRGSGNSGNNYQGYSDEDARSQASGSSAASGASAVSSHGEAESNHNQQDRRYENPEQTRRSQIPQYGLRNTVDIGQHHHNMENPDKGNNRGQRSMSAPPENRQTCNLQQPQQQEQTPQPQGQRYVSRIDITPQHNQPQQQQKPQQQPPQQPQQQQQQKSQQGNVRHIPIFVEGRDEPVMPRSFDEPHIRREPSPTQFQTPPYFQRPFGQHFGGRSHQRSPHFQDPFYQSPSSFEHPSRRQQQAPNYQQQPRQQQYEQPKQPQRQQPQQQHPPQQQQQQQQQQEQEPPRPKPVVPKDPLERVAMVQKEVDCLAEQVKQYTGNSRTDKEYIYLDEMLTRELIKLDDIETEGRDNVRQARRNTIKSIQETISFLESKAPLPSQQTSLEEKEKQEDQASNKEETGQTESMDVDQKQEDQSQSKEPIPLPPVPSSPTKQSEEASTEKMDDSSKDQPMSQQQEASQTSGEPMDTASSDKPETTLMEIQENTEKQKNDAEQTVQNVPEEKKSKNVPEEKKPESVAEEKKPENVSEEKKPENPSAENASEEKPESVSEETKQEANASKAAVESQPQKPVEKMEVDNEVKQSPKLQKKGKKTKKQAPVSDKAIPLPAPESAEATAK